MSSMTGDESERQPLISASVVEREGIIITNTLDDGGLAGTHHQRLKPPPPRQRLSMIAGIICIAIACSLVVVEALMPRHTTTTVEDFGGAKCDGSCPAIKINKPRATQRRQATDTGSAHVLLLGDSTDKLWHMGFCNAVLPSSSRCSRPHVCTNPTASFLPNNMGPLVCGNGDDRCERDSCYQYDNNDTKSHSGVITNCWATDNEVRTAAACKPLDPQEPAFGFVHMCGVVGGPVWTNADGGNSMYQTMLLPCHADKRIHTAVRAFDAYSKRRPVVVVINIAFWWAGNNLGWDTSWAGKLSTKADVDAELAKYRADLTALRDVVDKEMKKTGREYALVGRSNHVQGFKKGAEANAAFMVAMARVAEEVFSDADKKNVFFYDWRAVSEAAAEAGRWRQADNLHQDEAASELQVRAFTKWSARTLPERFAVRLADAGAA